MGFATATLSVIIKEVVDYYKRKFEKKSAKQEELNNYAKPLSSKCNDLFWRLREIIIQKRHEYLSTSGQDIEFYNYKLASTVYRLGCFLAQLRIISEEVYQLKSPKNNNLEIMNAANQVQKDLADGDHVEELLLQNFIDTFSEKTVDKDTIKNLVPEFGTHAQTLLANTSNSKLLHLRRFEDKEAMVFAEGIKKFLEKKNIKLNLAKKKDIRSFLTSVSYREFYLYRDWQNAMAAAMIEDGKIIDYGTFEKIYNNSQHDKHKVICRAKNLFIDINPNDPRDLRVPQLEKTFQNLFLLLQKINESFNDCSTPSKNDLTNNY